MRSVAGSAFSLGVVASGSFDWLLVLSSGHGCLSIPRGVWGSCKHLYTALEMGDSIRVPLPMGEQASCLAGGVLELATSLWCLEPGLEV